MGLSKDVTAIHISEAKAKMPSVDLKDVAKVEVNKNVVIVEINRFALESLVLIDMDLNKPNMKLEIKIV